MSDIIHSSGGIVNHHFDKPLEPGGKIGGAAVVMAAGQPLGVELGADDGQGLMLIGFDDAFNGAAGDLQALAQPADGLVVGGVDLKLGAEDLTDDRSFLGEAGMAEWMKPSCSGRSCQRSPPRTTFST